MKKNSMEMDRVIKELISRDEAGVRALMLSDEWLIRGLNALKRRLDDGERDAVRIYFESIKLVGAQPQVAVMIGVWNQLGVSSEDEARALIRLARSSESSDPDVLALKAAEFIGGHLVKNPELRAEIARRIGMV